eukprot:scaffold97_cov261-Pinguiococcus_pyrenoidosus.AAC.16
MQVLVLPSPAPSLPDLRCRRVICLAGSSSSAPLGARPPRPSFEPSTPHSFRKVSTSTEEAGCSSLWTRRSHTSKPIPPAPMTTTFLPTGAFFASTST